MAKKLKLERPLVFFDLETTGVSTTLDRIIELSYIKVYPDGHEESETIRINPGRPIPPASTAVHHITDADVAGAPHFEEIAQRIFDVFEDSDVAGFNSNKFDVPMLMQEFSRARLNFRVFDRKFVDVQTIYHKMEPRTLVAAYRYYCGGDLENAHSAMADTRATYEVLLGQLERYEGLACDVDGLADFCGSGNSLDLASRFIKGEDGQPIFNFGKHKGKNVYEVFRQEPSFYHWMQGANFDKNTKDVATRLYMEARKK